MLAAAVPDSNDGKIESRLATLMEAVQNGDRSAYDALLRACLPIIVTTVRRQGVSQGQVDDVVQDVLLTIHRVRHTYDPARAFLPWLRAISQRRAIDMLRRGGRLRTRELHDPAAYEGHADTAPAAGHTLEQADRVRRLAEAVGGLPKGQREAVVHLALREQSLKEASANTGRSQGALKVNLHRALKALRGRLDAGPDGDV